MNKFLAVVLVTLLAVLLSAASYFLLRTLYPSPEPLVSMEQAPAPAQDLTEQTESMPLPSEQEFSSTPPDTSKEANRLFKVYEQGVLFLENGNFEDAIRSFEQVKDHFPDALLGLGFAHYSLKEYDKAKTWLESSLQVKDSLLARKVLARIEYINNNLQAAFDHAKAGLSIREDTELRNFHDQMKKELAVQRNYIKEVSSHFDFYYDGYEQRDTGRTVAELLENAYSDIGRDLGFFPDNAIQVIMYTSRDFHDVTHTPAWTGGLFDGKIRVPLKGAGNDLSLLKRVLYHEYVHALVFSLTNNCPVWLNEGLAEYFSNGPAASPEFKLPLDSLNRPFLSIPGGSVRAAYQSSHSAVSALIGRYGMYRVKELLLKLSLGISFEEAFYAVYPLRFSEFHTQWMENR